MDEQVLTTEPTIVESSTENTAVSAENSTVINNATPMDANVTYNSLPKAEYQPSMSPVQNMVNEAVQIEHAINQESNAGKAMNQFLTQGYDYDKNEAGSYWVAGAINDNNTQMNFLQTLINEEMYDEMDLQKYYYDTNLATARAYAAQKKKEVAYGFYQAAQQRAYAEGELTGWYMPAEGRYLLGQYTVAQNTLEDPDATVEDKAKASRISKTAEEWFAANQITTRGIKCLAMMNYEETVRHNTVMGELNKQANAIAGAAASYSAKLAQLNLKDRIFQLEEEELASGEDLTYKLGLDDNQYIGHDPKDYEGLEALRGYESTAEMLYKDADSFASVIGSGNTEWVRNIMEEAGYNFEDRFKYYSNDQTLANMKTDINKYSEITQDSFTKIGKTDSEGHELVYAVVGNEAIVGYFDKGSWVPITDENAKFADNKSIKNFIENRFGKGTFNTEGINAVTIDGTTYSFGVENTIGSNTSVKALQEAGYEKYYTTNFQKGNNAGHPTDIKKVEDIMAQSQTTEGIKDSDGEYARNLEYIPEKWESKLVNEFCILKGTNAEGKPQYYSVTEKGILKKVDASDLVDVPSVKNLIGSAGASLNPKEPKHLQVIKSSWIIGYSKETDVTYMALPRSNGEIELYSLKGNVKSQPTSNSLTIVNNNVSQQDILDAGFKLPNTTPVSETYKTLTGKYNDYSEEPKQETAEVTPTTSTGVSVAPSGKGNDYKPGDLIKAIYKKYNLTEEDIQKVKDITDPEKLIEKIQEIYNQVLSMGGEHSGK
jgi:hypothetical protein